MKRILLSWAVLCVVSLNLIAQTVPSSEKKIAQSEDAKLYVNKALGIYLWLSTSPDPGSEKIRLKSDSTKKYVNPMYLDTEGYNTVRSPSAVDTLSGKTVYPIQDIIFEVYADGQPPVSKAKFESIQAKMIDGKKYYGGDLVIGLYSTDQVSGVEKLYHCLNGGSYSEYKGKLSNFEEGVNTLKYFSVDRVGNQEKVREEVFYINKTPSYP